MRDKPENKTTQDLVRFTLERNAVRYGAPQQGMAHLLQPATMPGGALSQIPQACFGKGAPSGEKGEGKRGKPPEAGVDGDDVRYHGSFACDHIYFVGGVCCFFLCLDGVLSQ